MLVCCLGPSLVITSSFIKTLVWGREVTDLDGNMKGAADNSMYPCSMLPWRPRRGSRLIEEGAFIHSFIIHSFIHSFIH